MKKTVWKAVRPVVTAAVAGCFLVTAAGCTYPWASAAPTEETPAAVADSSPSDETPDTTAGQDTSAPADPFATSTEAAQGETVAADDAFSKNPSVDLPDEIAPSIPEDATFVGPELVATESGKILKAATGETVTDPEVVGTADTPPDPLVRSEGHRFIPETVEEVREKVGDDAEVSEGASGTTDAVARRSGEGSVTSSAYLMSDEAQAGKFPAESVALQNNNYGAYWGTYGGMPAFFERGGNLFAQQAKGVIDVSEHQGRIDWAKVKASGVEGAIIRIGYGQYNWDKQAKRNIAECKRLGIPFGIYLYSYAYDAGFARTEGRDTASMLKNAGVSGKTAYPIYYDLEAWSWTGHAHPTNPRVYDGIVNAWYAEMKAAGFTNLGVYSYTSFLHSALNSANIHSKTTWVAQYGAKMQYINFPSNFRGWQYWSSGRVNGIAGNVDLNVFGNKTVVASDTNGKDPSIFGKKVSTNFSGSYYLKSAASNYVLDVNGNSKANGAEIDLWKPQKTKNQEFVIETVSSGTYRIRSASSGKVLDASGLGTRNGTKIDQWTWNGGSNQKWNIYKSPSGTYMFVSVNAGSKNKVLDANAGHTNLPIPVTLWAANGGSNQFFELEKVPGPSPTQYGTRVYDFSTGNYVFETASKQVFDIKGMSKENSASLIKWRAGGTNNQVFRVTEIRDGVYSLVNIRSKKAIDIPQAKYDNGTKLIQFDQNKASNQLWEIYRTPGGTLIFKSVGAGQKNLVIDVPGGSNMEGISIGIWEFNNGKNQQFNLKRVGEELYSDSNLNTSLPEGDYTIKSKQDNEVLDVKGNSRFDSARIITWAPLWSKNQVWHLRPAGGGDYFITSSMSGKSLDISGNSREIGSPLIQYSINGEASQRWRIYSAGSGFSYIAPSTTSGWFRVLDRSGMGNEMNLWNTNGGANQLFEVKRLR